MKQKNDLSILARAARMLSGARRLHKKNRPFCVILMMLMTMTAQTAWATPDGIIYVSAIGDDANDGSEIAPVATIGKAVEYATDGETIFINDGEYTEENTITLEKSLSFEGESQDGVKITGAAKSLFSASAADLTLSFSNLTILNAGGENNPAMILTKALQDLTITNCTFDNCSSWYGAIQISKVTGEAVIDGCKILNSKCTNDGGAGAIHINNSGTFTIMNTLIDGVQVTGSSYMNGVICLYNANATLNIENTTITNVKNVDNETNVVTPVPARAVIYNQRGTVNIKDSKIQGNLLKRYTPNRNNIIYNNEGTVTIEQTIISDNTCEDEVFYNSGSSPNLTVNYCNIQNNAASGIINNNGTIDLNANWWGANVLPVGVTAESWIVEEDGVLRICNHGENEEMIGEHIVPGWDGVLLITAESWGAYKNGSEENPYVINSTAALNRLAIEVNAGESYEGKFFELGADIAYTYTTDWDDDTSEENNYTAIGTYDHPFKGTFDGKNYTISGIRIYKNDDTDDEYQGLFGYVGEGGTVKNVILSDARITGHGPVGGIAGSNDGTIENCLVTASVSTTALDGDVGGIVGFNFATVKGNMVIGAIVTSGNNEAGGIAAYSSCLGVNGENPGSVTGNLVIGATVSGASFGAIVSNNEYSNLSSNYYNGCTVGETVNATGVGVFCFDFSTGSKDITTNEGAVAGYFLTLGEGITAATAKAVVTVPEHKDLDDAGELVTVDEKTYNIFTIDQEVTLSASEEGYLLTNCTVTKDDDDSDVTYDVLSGTTLTMPDYNITVTGTTEICTPSDIEITSANFTDYFYYDADFEYSNSTPTTGLAGEGTDYDKNKKGGYFLKATVAAESNLDFKGDFIPDATGNFNPRIIINKRVNITSSDKSAVFMPYISNDETVKLYWNFGIIAGADYTEVENLQFENCWVFNYGSSYVTFDGIDMKVEDVRIGSGVGGLSILTTEEGAHAADHATVKNSTFYFKSNGGTAGIIAGCGAPYATFDNNTITGEGNVGNMLYASPFNSKGDYPEFATFTNNVITKTDAATAICYGLVSCGQGNLIENNTVNYAGSAITTAWGGSTLSETSAKNTYRNNTTTLGGSMTVHNYSDIENNQVSGLLTVAQGATATGNTAAEMTVSGQDATIKNNTVNGDVTISKTIASFTDNAIYGTLTVSSTNNTITGNVILSSGQNAIVLNSSDNTVSGNILISADHEGDAAVQTTNTNTIANNTLAAYESATASSHSNTPYMITSETTTLLAGDNAGTFYYVPTNATVTINGELAITPIEGTTSPKVNLLLGDGDKLRVDNISGSDCSLTIYGQSLDYNIGQLSVVGSDKAIDVCNYTQNGGYVKAEGDNYGLYATGNVTLNGGTFSAYSYSLDTDRPGIYCGAGKKIILGGGYVDSNFLSGGDDFAIEIPDGAFYIDGYANIYDNSYPDDLLDAWADPDETCGFLLLFPGKDVKGVTLTKDSNDDWTATFDGNSLEESYSIPYSCSVEEVHFNRTFTEGKKTCICWPFSVSKTEAAALGTFYEFSAVTAEGKIQMTEVTNGLDYNKPYIFEPKADITSIELDSRRLNFTYNPKVTNGDLTFKGIYDRVKWTKDTTDPLYDADRAAELGKAYGFALEELAGYSVGQFAKLGSGAHSRPFRAYLINEGDWNGEEPGTAARGTSAKTLPDVIEIEWISAKGETTGISTLDTRTGEITDGVWFTLDGRRLEGKPAKKGLYINNGKKVLVP